MTQQKKFHFNKDQIKCISANDLKIVLTSLGLDPNLVGNVKGCCPIHNGDNPTAFSFDLKLRLWSCFTHKCHEKYGNDIIGLVKGMQKCNFPQACQYITDLIELNPNEKEDYEHKIFINSHQKSYTNNQKFDISKYKPCRQPLLDKGYSLETINKFKPVDGGSIDKTLYGRYAFPITDENGVIVGFTGRRLNDKLNVKWMNFPESFSKTDHLFGIHVARESIEKYKKAILVEGPHDVMQLHEAKIQYTVGFMGTTLSITQIKKLMKLGCKEVILLLDPDQAGKESALNIANKLEPYFKVTNLTDKLLREPADMTPKELQEFLNYDYNTIR